MSAVRWTQLRNKNSSLRGKGSGLSRPLSPGWATSARGAPAGLPQTSSNVHALVCTLYGRGFDETTIQGLPLRRRPLRDDVQQPLYGLGHSSQTKHGDAQPKGIHALMATQHRRLKHCRLPRWVFFYPLRRNSREEGHRLLRSIPETSHQRERGKTDTPTQAAKHKRQKRN